MEHSRPSFFLKTFFPACLGLIFLVTALLGAADCRADEITTTTSEVTTTISEIPATTSILPTTSSTSSAPATSTTTGILPTTVTIAWDASPDNVTGYTVFYGEQSVRAYPAAATPQPVGNVLQCTITGLLPDHTYYFAVKAYNNSKESGFSNEIILRVNTDGTVTAVSTTTTTSIRVSTLPSTTSSLPKAPYTTSVPGASTSASTLRTTTSTTPGATTSTTASDDMTKKFVLGGKGAGAVDGGPPAVENEQAELGAPDSVFTDQGAIAVFADTDSPSQLSVGWDDYNDLNGEARIATGDIDGDKKDEIIIGLGPVQGNSAIPGGKFQILDDDFTDLGWGEIDWSSYNSINGESWPACGDIDGDGVDEILMGLGVGGEGRIEVFKFKNRRPVHTSWLKVGWEDYCTAGGGVRPACGNIDLDRKAEIILGLYPVNDLLLPAGKFEVLDGSAKHLAWGTVDWSDYNSLSGETRPACGDINRTVRDEILLGLGTGSGGRVPVYAYAPGTVTLKTWLNAAGEPDYRVQNGETRLSCGDMDGDGLDEILIGFGQGGQGMMELHDDGLHDFSILSRLLIPDDNYNIVNGEAYPAIKDIKSDYSRVMNFFLKSLSNKRPKQP